VASDEARKSFITSTAGVLLFGKNAQKAREIEEQIK
jgi:hypothetical protein